MRTQLRSTILLALMLFAVLPVAAQTPVTSRYIYDQNGRLRAVITPEGAAVYDYDAAGNFTAIRNLGRNGCEAIEFTPRHGPPGTPVTIYGIGLSEQVRVTFNGAPATITARTATSVTASVPDGATTGSLVVSMPCGTKRFATPFTVSGVRLMPSTITLLPGRRVQFSATVAGILDPSVDWSVNGVKGGNDSVGRITESGFYATPEAALSAQFMVRATSVAEPALFGEAIVRVAGTNGNEILASAISVRYGPPEQNERVPPYLAGAAVSVRYGPLPRNNDAPASLAASALSVRYGPLPHNNSVPAQIGGEALSVRYGPAAANNNLSASIGGQAVLVRYGPLPANNNTPAQILSGSVSARYGPAALAGTSEQLPPVISSVSVTAATPGQLLTLTIKGKHLSGVTEIKFFNLEGTAEPRLTATQIEVNAKGTLLTAKVTVSDNTPHGRYAVQVLTAASDSSATATKSNTIELIP